MKLRVVHILFLLLLSSCPVLAQSKNGESRVVDSYRINGEDNMLISKFLIPDHEVLWGKVHVSKKKLHISFYCKEVPDTIFSYHSDNTHSRWEMETDKVSLRNGTKYVGGLYTTLYGEDTYPIYVFYGDSLLRYSYMENNRSSWLNNRILTISPTGNNRIIGVLSGYYANSHVFFNSTDDQGIHSIVGVTSVDNGFNWKRPSMAIRHNKKNLEGCSIAAKKERPASAYMILIDNNNTPYYSHTGDGGTSWSYPQKISDYLVGDSHTMTIDRGYVVVAFRRTTNDQSGDHNDIMLWHGTIQEFVSDSKRGNLMKIIDNSANDEMGNSMIEDIAYYKSKQYFVLLKYRDEFGSTLQVHLIRRMKL